MYPPEYVQGHFVDASLCIDGQYVGAPVNSGRSYYIYDAGWDWRDGIRQFLHVWTESGWGNPQEPSPGTYTARYEYSARYGFYMKQGIHGPYPWDSAVDTYPGSWWLTPEGQAHLPTPAVYLPQGVSLLPDEVPRPWTETVWPGLSPILPRPDANPTPRPISRPIPYVPTISPEMPQHGPAPTPAPAPAPIPGPVVLPEIPEIAWPNPGTPTETIIAPRPGVAGQPAYWPNVSPKPQNNPARRPPKGTKERKIRMNRTLGIIWASFSHITEGTDYINAVYEALPWRLKVREYQTRGRQPNPAEKLRIIYENINDVDIVKATQNFTKNYLEDMIYALGGKQAAEAARNDNRPIGYEAGGGLTGGGGPLEFSQGGVPNTAPDWFPTDWVPW